MEIDRKFWKDNLLSILAAGLSIVIEILEIVGIISQDNILSSASFPILIGAIIIWCISRYKKWIKQVKLNPDKATVLVAFSTDDSEDSKRIRNDLYVRMKQIASTKKYNKFVEYHYVEDENILKSITTFDDVKNIQNKTRARVVIGGRLEVQTNSGKIYYVFSHWGIGYLTKKGIPIRPNETLFTGFCFPIDNNETLKNIQILSENFTLFVNCILSFSLVFSGFYKESKDLLFRMYEESKFFPVNNQMRSIRYLIVDMLFRSIIKCISDEYNRFILPYITSSNVIEVSTNILQQIDNVIKEKFICNGDLFLYSNMVNIYLSMLYNFKAILLFSINKAKESRIAIKEAIKITSLDTHKDVYNLSLAFLILWNAEGDKSNYKSAAKKYKKYFNKGISSKTAYSITEFIQYAIRNNPNRTDLLFIVAIMSHFCDRDNVIYHWQEFRDKNQQTEENKQLFDLSDYCLESYHKNQISKKSRIS